MSDFVRMLQGQRVEQTFRVVETPFGTTVHVKAYVTSYDQVIAQRWGGQVVRERYEMQGAETIFSVGPGYLYEFKQALTDWGWREAVSTTQLGRMTETLRRANEAHEQEMRGRTGIAALLGKGRQ